MAGAKGRGSHRTFRQGEILWARQLGKGDDLHIGTSINPIGGKKASIQACMATGGPCEYKRRDMTLTHAELEITNAEFAYVVDDRVKTLDQ